MCSMCLREPISGELSGYLSIILSHENLKNSYIIEANEGSVERRYMNIQLHYKEKTIQTVWCQATVVSVLYNCTNFTFLRNLEFWGHFQGLQVSRPEFQTLMSTLKLVGLNSCIEMTHPPSPTTVTLLSPPVLKTLVSHLSRQYISMTLLILVPH